MWEVRKQAVKMVIKVRCREMFLRPWGVRSGEEWGRYLMEVGMWKSLSSAILKKEAGRGARGCRE